MLEAARGMSSSLSIRAWCTADDDPDPPPLQNKKNKGGGIKPLFTFVDKVLGLQVEAFPVALPPQAGHGGVKLPVAVGLHGGGCGQEVSLPADVSRPSIRPAASPLRAPRRHLERQVVVGDVDVARVVALVGVVLAPLAVSPRVGLVPVVGADRHGEQPERAERQEEPRARQ